MKSFTFIFFAMLLPALVWSQKKLDSTFTVKVSTKGMQKGIKIYLAYQVNGWKIIDSARQNPAQGIYTFRGKITSPVPATLVADPDGLGL